MAAKAKRKNMRFPNGYGSITKLSGNRRKPYIVKVNTKIDERNYPVYDILGYYEEYTEALEALVEYNKSPFDVDAKNLTFKDVYNLYFENKYVTSKKQLSESSKACTIAAYKKCEPLHNLIFADINSIQLQTILDNHEYSHATLEHVKNLYRQMYKYAMQFKIVETDCSLYAEITKPDDDEHGVPFTEEEIRKLWHCAGTVPYVDTILIYIYSGWRVSELIKMPVSDIDLENKTFKGGVKTRASKNRIVPIHSKIYPLVEDWKNKGFNSIFSYKDRPIKTTGTYYKLFKEALTACEITVPHTPHDCRHTFATLLNNAGANEVCVKTMLGHAIPDITKGLYTHKDIEELRKAIELI